MANENHLIAHKNPAPFTATRRTICSKEESTQSRIQNADDNNDEMSLNSAA